MRFSFLLPSLFLLCACGPQDPPSCPGPRPAFRVQIRPEGDVILPRDTVVAIRYGGNGEEEFRLESPPSQPQVLFCATPSGAGGAAGEGGTAGAAGTGSTGQGATGGAAGTGGPGQDAETRVLSCELWTDGAANLKINAEGFQEYDEMLAATTDDCGVQTTLLEILLSPETGAGGSS